MGIPMSGPGFYVVEIESQLLGERLLVSPEQAKALKSSRHKAPSMYVPTAALVTNLAAHFKWGRGIVPGLGHLSGQGSAGQGGRCFRQKLQWKDHLAGERLTIRALPPLKRLSPPENELPYCKLDANYSEVSQALGSLQGGLYVFARTGQDMTFTHSSWDEGIEPWRYQLPAAYGSAKDGIIAHTILDRKLFRAGETVHMKHILRRACHRWVYPRTP